MRSALEAKGEDRMDFVDLKKMFTEASDNKYPESELLEVRTKLLFLKVGEPF